MAIEFTPDDVASGYNLTKINNNFDKVDTALQDALSRSGNGPNQMNADIDLNSNDLLNVKNTFTESLVLNGGVVTPEELVTLPPIVMTKSVYDPQGKEADAFARANHTGTQSIVTLTDWQPEYSFRRYVTQAQWNDILDGTQTAHLSVELQEAEDDVSSKGGGKIIYPAGVIPVDGFKGAESSFNINRRGGLYLKGGVHHVGVKGKTIWRNIANDWRCIVSAKEASDWSIKDIILDGDRYNHPNAVLASDSIRGEGIIFWGFTENLKNVRIEGVETRNMGHYGIGVQNVEIDGLDIIGCYGYDCGGDFIDIKDYPALNLEKTGIRILGNTARRIGTNWQERVAEGAGPQAGFDIRGACLVANNYVFDLDSYDATQVGNDGVRVNADVTVESRKGGARSLLVNNWVRSVKLDSEGSGSVKRIRGLVISDENVSVNGHYNENCYIGTLITNSGDSIANRSTVLSVTNKNCKGAAADGIGTQIGSGTLGHKIDVTNVSCDIGFTCNGTASSGRVTNTNCTLGNNLTASVMSLNNFSFNKANNTSNSTVLNAQHNFAEELTVWGTNGGYLNLRSTLNGTWTTPFEAGGINVYKEDTSGAGAGLAAYLRTFFTGSTGAGAGWRIAATDGVSAPITIVDFQGDRTIWNNALIPNFADDVAAAAGGVPLGGMYRTTSALKVRVA